MPPHYANDERHHKDDGRLLREKDRWLLWYNGRNGGLERIGQVIFDGKDWGF
jgi:hypothetical protein